MQTQYFIITRFNIPLHWPPKHSIAAGWLDRRFELFDQLCFPSVSAQDNRNFTWLVLFDSSTPASFRARIRTYQQNCPMFNPVFLPPEGNTSDRAYLVSGRYASALEPFLGNDTEYVVTTRLDSDDAIHRTFMSRLQNCAKTQDLRIFNFPSGYYLDLRTNATFHVIDERGTNTISFLERRRPREDLRTVYIFDRHTEATDHRDVIQISGEPGWIMCVHDKNIMNDIRWARSLGGVRITCPREKFVRQFNVRIHTALPDHIKNTQRDILVVTPVPTHPQNYGNRKRVYRVCRALQKLGARIHLLHYPAEHGWWNRIPLEANQAMQRQWDSYYLVHPTRDRHTPAIGEDHRIDDWWDESVGEYLEWLCGVQRLDMAIVNYTWMSRAFAHIPDHVYKVLDTHDRVSGRRELLHSAGIEPEFFHSTEEEEARALRRADLVLGIKEQESEYFQRISGVKTQTLVHCDPPFKGVARSGTVNEGVVTIGFIGAHNSLNRVALKEFLELCRDEFRRAGNIRFLIGGTVTDYFQNWPDPFVESLRLEGDVKEFYNKVDMVVIPMVHSTGFKIKAAEALSFAKPLVSSAHAMEGIPTDVDYHQYHDVRGILHKCLDVARNPEILKDMAAASKLVHARLRARFKDQLHALLGHNLPSLAAFVLSSSPGILQGERQRELLTMISDWWDVLLFVHGDGQGNHAVINRYRKLNAVYDSTCSSNEKQTGTQTMSWEQLQESARLTVTWVDSNSALFPRSGLRIVDAEWGKTNGGRCDRPLEYEETTILVSAHRDDTGTSGAGLSRLPTMFFIRPPRTGLWQSGSSARIIALLADTYEDVRELHMQLMRSGMPDGVEFAVFSRDPDVEDGAKVSHYCISTVTGDLSSLPARPEIVIDAAGRAHHYFSPLREYIAWSRIPVLVYGSPARIWQGGEIEVFSPTVAGIAAVSDRVSELLRQLVIQQSAGSATLDVLKRFIEQNSKIRQLRLNLRDRRLAED